MAIPVIFDAASARTRSGFVRGLKNETRMVPSDIAATSAGGGACTASTMPASRRASGAEAAATTMAKGRAAMAGKSEGKAKRHKAVEGLPAKYVWDEEREAAITEVGADFPENHRFNIPEGAHWSDVRATSTDVGQARCRGPPGSYEDGPRTLQDPPRVGRPGRVAEGELHSAVQALRSTSLQL